MTTPVEEYLRTLAPEHQESADPHRIADALSVAHRSLAIEILRRGMALLFLASIIAALGLVAQLTRPEPTALLALALSLVPAWMYWGFAANQVPLLYEEYVMALHRMRADSPGYLPAPPRDSSYWREWASARGPDGDRNGVNLYVSKFEALYGRVAPVVSLVAQSDAEEVPRGVAARRRHSRRPKGGLAVALLTVVLGAGWIAVLQPDLYRDMELPFVEDVGPAAAYAFVGAYLSIVQQIISRYFTATVNSGVYISSVMRLAVVIVVTVLLAHVFPLSTRWLEFIALVVGFLSGMFPVVPRALSAVATMRRRQNQLSLMALDGMNVWYEARLFEGAIEDVESLCSASLVDLVLVRTAPTARLVDWIDQGMLRIHTDASSLDRLRRLGIRTATDLLRVVNSTSVNVDVQDVTVPLETIRSAVQGEPNLFHVSAWKERATVATAPPAESP